MDRVEALLSIWLIMELKIAVWWVLLRIKIAPVTIIWVKIVILSQLLKKKGLITR